MIHQNVPLSDQRAGYAGRARGERGIDARAAGGEPEVMAVVSGGGGGGGGGVTGLFLQTVRFVAVCTLRVALLKKAGWGYAFDSNGDGWLTAR